MSLTPKQLWFWTSFVIWLVIDQATKIWITSNLEYGRDEIEVIPGFLSFIHAQNPGAAFSILADFAYRQQVFLLFTLVAIGVVVQMFRQLLASERLLPMALGLILSGAVGNAIDRIHKQSVTDFIRVYTESETLRPWLIERVGTAEWPTFNIADSTLLVGVVIFFIHGAIYGDAPPAAADEAQAGGSTPAE